MRFEPLHRVWGGHKFFRDMATGKIAIADQSGITPDRTDDGVLYLDRSRPIVRRWLSRRGESITVPLEMPDGKKVSTVACWDEAKWLLDNMGMKLHDIQEDAWWK